jgi:[ribosomal protein S5]-alanine N-acetyltransferase
VILTSRLILRPFLLDDVAALFEIQGDAVAMKFTYVAPTIEACRERLLAYENLRAKHGFAPWTICSRETRRIVGWGGLGVDPFDPGWGPEVSYAFHSSSWGQGLATELVQESLRYAFQDMSLRQVSAFAMPENIASIRVLEKCGFSFVKYEPSLKRNYFRHDHR